MASQSVLQEIMSSLNEQQRRAVQFDHTKALQVIAGPGTGKTKVLTSRVAYLLLHHRINPQDIIVTTFTNKAAKEMIDRLIKMLRGTDIRVSDIMIGTFHSVCLKILTRFGHKIGLRKDWRIIDESEVDTIMEEMIKQMPDQIRDQAHSVTRKINLCLPKRGTDEWAVHPKLVKKQISRLKAYTVIPEEYQKDSNYDQALGYFYEKYQVELDKVNALDFDDLLMYTFRLLTKERCLPYVQHVLVDEFQDTNGIQMDLMFLFAKANHHLSRGISVVGDPDQSIYAFRHALAQNFEAMANKCPIECSRVILVENYRSSQRILDTSETLIKQQIKGRADRLPLHAQFDCEFPPVYISFPALFLEGPSLVREMLYLRSLPDLFTYNDFAILVRQRRQMKNIETALIEHRIPYKIIRGHAFWELKETVSMLNLLKCVYSDNEKHAILSSLQYPARGLGPTSAERIKHSLEEFQGSPFQGLKDIRDNKIKVNIPIKARKVVGEFVAMIEGCQQLKDGSVSTLLCKIFDKLYEASGMRHEYLFIDGKKKSELGSEAEPNFTNARHKNVTILKKYFIGSEDPSAETVLDPKRKEDIVKVGNNSAQINSASSIQNHFRNFFLSLSLFSTDTTADSEIDKAAKLEQEKKGFVTLSTIHGAKGLEWPVVFIPGCEDGIIPSIFGDERAQNGGENSNDGNEEESDEDKIKIDCDKTTKLTASPSKNQPSGTEESVDEERRMFFVAQTRAKHLLYHSSVNGSSGRSDGTPSRFLSTELLSTMVDQQKLFDSIKSIKMIYQSLGRKPPPEGGKFSFKRLVEDYSKFIENRRERFVWNGEFLSNIFELDITKNTTANYSTGFTTAAAQLSYTTTSPTRKGFLCGAGSEFTSPTISRKSMSSSPKRNCAPPSMKVGDIRLISPTKNCAPKSPSGSPVAKRTFAPSYTPNRNAPNTLRTDRRLFAPNQEVPSLKSEKKTSSLAVESDPKSLSTDSLKGNERETSKNNMKHLHEAHNFSVKNERDDCEIADLSLSKRHNPQRLKRRLVTTPIDISERDLFSRVKREELSASSSPFIADDGFDTTAAELLHNPDDVVIDSRPIIANAKTLADAARRANRGKQKVKKEGTSSQIDIFSQLSRAKKKAKIDESEIIVID